MGQGSIGFVTFLLILSGCVVPPLEPAASASPTPTSQSAGSLTVTASVSDSTPCRYSNVQVYVHVEDASGTGVGSASVTSSWYYKTTTSYESGTTSSSGDVTLERYISSATAGYTVQVSVTGTKGSSTGSGSTSFTPVNC